MKATKQAFVNRSDNEALFAALEKKNKKQGWMTTFADMMMLLLCFFVLLFSFSHTNQQKFNSISASFSRAFGLPDNAWLLQQEAANNTVELEAGDSLLGTRQYQPSSSHDIPSEKAKESPPDVLHTLKKRLQQSFTGAPEKRGVIFDLQSNVLKIQLDSTIAYASGSGFLQPKAEKYLHEIASLLIDIPGSIEVVGHTDNQAVDNDLYQNNVELSLARAQAVANVLTHNLPQRTIAISGKGDSQPIAQNSHKAGRTQNRRVEIIITHGRHPISSLPLPIKETSN
ncbi:flagellar motor protein MotB [Planctobacterium marinum]|uniref:Flagellar motor protein MotB n=1 Tax=Planctobacterium marinum TaxID=1631968 RepID=A0AA48HII1_9ALTE|nr:flagellar motor protein MotB [Planctobacterium marinum]